MANLQYSETNYGRSIGLDTLSNIINSGVGGNEYIRFMDIIRTPINNEVVAGLDELGVHMIKSEHPRVNKFIKVYIDKSQRYVEIEKLISQQIIYQISRECNKDQAVVFWDFLKEIIINDYPTEMGIGVSMYGNQKIGIGVKCSYDIVNKEHFLVTPPKNIVKMLISNEKYEKNKF